MPSAWELQTPCPDADPQWRGLGAEQRRAAENRQLCLLDHSAGRHWAVPCPLEDRQRHDRTEGRLPVVENDGVFILEPEAVGPTSDPLPS